MVASGLENFDSWTLTRFFKPALCLVVAITLLGCDQRFETPAKLPALSVNEMVHGTDTDANGVRDEIDVLLRNLFPETQARMPWLFYAKSLQRAAEVELLTTPKERDARWQSVQSAKSCLTFLSMDNDLKDRVMRDIWVVTLDSPLRRSGWDLLAAHQQSVPLNAVMPCTESN